MHNRSGAMKLAIMQPYFFPYIGYWQLMHAADRFVIYDDVNFIKNGWINRNRVLINGAATYITVPLFQSSSFKKICDTGIQPTSVWRNKLSKMVENTYRRSPYFDEVFPVIDDVIRHETENLADYLSFQLWSLASFMHIDTEIINSSRIYGNAEMSGQDRIVDICSIERATVYINPQGGQMLYDKNTFLKSGIDLRFIVMEPLPYKQKNEVFIPSLSIVDGLMEVGPLGIKTYLDAFNLI
jgi:hypothetical protein